MSMDSTNNLWDMGGSIASGLAGMYGAYNSYQNANQQNSQVQSSLGQNSSALSTQIQSLQDQIAQNRTTAQSAYNTASQQYGTQNSALQGNIGTMTSSLNALSDPNSAYMQQARQAIERKDAAAGRNSQWGERETQLAGTLADYVGKYAPGINNSITNAQGQINQNNLGLANMYSTINNPADRNTLALIQALQTQQAGAAAANTTGRQAGNSANNNLNSLIGQGIKGIGGLASLFGGSGGAGSGIGSYFTGNASPTNGITGQDGGYGYGSVGSLYDGGAGSGMLGGATGYGSLPAGNYLSSDGFLGTPTAGFGTSYQPDYTSGMSLGGGGQFADYGNYWDE